MTSEWQSIESAPRDGTLILGKLAECPKWPASGRMRYRVRKTKWGKTAHVPLYGWIVGFHRVEETDLWSPTHWKPAETTAQEGK